MGGGFFLSKAKSPKLTQRSMESVRYKWTSLYLTEILRGVAAAVKIYQNTSCLYRKSLAVSIRYEPHNTIQEAQTLLLSLQQSRFQSRRMQCPDSSLGEQMSYDQPYRSSCGNRKPHTEASTSLCHPWMGKEC